MKCTPHSESRRQLMKDYLLAEAWHTPHHNLQLVQFMVMCLSGHTTTFPTASSQTSHKHNGKHAIASLEQNKFLKICNFASKVIKLTC